MINASEEGNTAIIHEGLAAFKKRYVRDATSQTSLLQAGLTSAVVPDLTLSWDRAPIAGGRGRLFVTYASEQGKSAALFSVRATQRLYSFDIARSCTLAAPRFSAPVVRLRGKTHGGETDAACPRGPCVTPVRFARTMRSWLAWPTRPAESSAAASTRSASRCACSCRFWPSRPTRRKSRACWQRPGCLAGSLIWRSLPLARPRTPPFSYEERHAIALFVDGALAKARRMFAEIADDAGEIRS